MTVDLTALMARLRMAPKPHLPMGILAILKDSVELADTVEPRMEEQAGVLLWDHMDKKPRISDQREVSVVKMCLLDCV